jgi:hypothetical protein
MVPEVRQIEIYTAEPLVPENNTFKAEITITTLESYITRYWSKYNKTDSRRKWNITIQSTGFLDFIHRPAF